MVKKLDIDALLKKNQRVNRDELIVGAKAPRAVAPTAIQVSPYSGRRLIVDDRSSLDEKKLRKPGSYMVLY
ncbi:MAG TPA: hypothetical protein VHB27_19730 [Rhodopila sp.]|uniref:hypothetical protein n=1 Tax=Rhodopila sp. TaxID=2480087 RepID=UPI002CE17A24|nr:hypothetical protein [Rhodopila sp.]HVY17463.1 hypothetical protein [Rhodopila sp.]